MDHAQPDTGKSESQPIVVTGGTRTRKQILHETRWLRLCQLDYTDQYGTQRKWDMVERANVTTDLDCIDVIPIIKKKGAEDVVILELQYRPPMDCLSLEFPSGLVDPGEDAETAALRELREETGYTGVVKTVTPAMSLEPGLASEKTKVVIVEIDGDMAMNQNPKQHLEGGECIELVFVPVSRMLDRIHQLVETRKCVPDAKLYTFALAQQMFAIHKPTN